MTNPTERPEERDSLAAVVRRFDATPKTLRNGQVYKDLRTLINEVKERDERLAHHDELFQAFQANKTDLEAEVKELREESRFLALRLKEAGEARETFEGMYRNAESEYWRWRTLAEETRAERKQMEEALRKIEAITLDRRPDQVTRIHAVATMALSPSDTEEPR